MTFSQCFGTPLANLVLRFCRVGADDLPNVHQVCASNEKRSRDTANINIFLYTQSLMTSYIRQPVNLPKVSPWMLDVFRQHDLVGNGMGPGAGLNPFSVLCA